MSVPTFYASLTEHMQKVVQDAPTLRSTITHAQRPIAISLPWAATENAEAFKKAMHNLSIDGRVFLAHKATSSPAILASLRGITSIDVASEAELENALKIGYTPESIIATGPKSDRFIKRLGLLPGVSIIVDSYGELVRLAEIVGEQPATVLLRLSRSVVNQPGITKRSRFGHDKPHLEQSLEFLSAHQNLSLKGIAFHLDSQSIDERQYAVQAAINTLLEIQQRGFYSATVLDIGGGYGTNYGLSEMDGSRFETAIKSMVMREKPSITWQSRSYGIRSDGNRIHGELTGVDTPISTTGVDRLISILSFQDENGISLAHQLNENLIELWIEPGSAICADAGLFAAEIIEVRQCDDEYTVVVDAHRNQISFEGSEHVADPLLISSKEVSNDNACEAYIAGHLCMESDFMTYRKIQFPQMPQSGDILVWTHTGAYRSHFSTSEAIGHPLPTRYTLNNDNQLIEDTV